MNRLLRWSAVTAALSFAIAVIAFGAVLEGYRQSLNPVALLGARTIPHAFAFNLLAFVLPGAMAACIAMALRLALPGDARWSARIGAMLILVASIAFAAQGLRPLDPDDLDASATHLHAAIWTVWWLAFAAGALLKGIGASHRGARAIVDIVAPCLVVLFAIPSWPWLLPGIAQRIAFGAWFAWLVVAGWDAQGTFVRGDDRR